MIHGRCNLLKQVSESTTYTPGDRLDHSIPPALMRGLICRLDSSSDVCPSPVCVVFSPHREEHEVPAEPPPWNLHQPVDQLWAAGDFHEHTLCGDSLGNHGVLSFSRTFRPGTLPLVSTVRTAIGMKQPTETSLWRLLEQRG